MEDGDFNSEKMQETIRENQAKNCQPIFNSLPGWCPQTWDEILCWPATAPNELAVQPCPHYIAGFDTRGNATRQCLSDGQWYQTAETNSTWTNYTQCYHTSLVTVLMDIRDLSSDNATLRHKYLPIIKAISKVGYAFSFSTLVVAFCILAAIKRRKLRCPRNILHIHLFASFMARAFMALLKDMLFVSGIGLASDIIVKNGEQYLKSDLMSCKIFTSIWQYFILANYSWILIEGLYLHNLVFLALFTDSNSSITGYIALGWGMPAIFVIPWIILRAVFDDTLCWTTNDNNEYLFLVIRIPTMLSILINFVLFVNIVRVLLSKLKSTVSEETQRYKRWARSTLVLVPLFGVHYTVFLGMSYSIGVNDTVEIVWLFCDQFFASFQGFFVAVLYCFLNGEVRMEVSRVLRSRKWPRLGGGGRWGQRHSTHSGSTCSCNASKLRKSSKSRWWHKPCICIFRERDFHHHRSSHSMASTQDVGLGTRGGSLTSSRGYIEGVGNGPCPGAGNCVQNANQTSPLCSKYTDQSLLSFCSNMSEVSTSAAISALEKGERIRDQHRWSDSECCQLAYELHSLHQQPQS
ncbi:secretin receptor-like isoform X3 [Leptopilina boulardi]|uniref:secretin receptor-like isoform X3 n=1 Tax=Leptopilina boulardi TaxID=63433 RepID=UPI0021F63DC4|nr:secretin receptor-like isoform X3 [Leptopilina boulardi]XP_051161571.1 secretin receptor-like isoform X3 [Leptopilina boulardi]